MAARKLLLDSTSLLRLGAAMAAPGPEGAGPASTAVPVPVSATRGSACAAEDEIATVALAPPAALGANVYSIAHEAPGASVAPWQASESSAKALAPGPLSESPGDRQRRGSRVGDQHRLRRALCADRLGPESERRARDARAGTLDHERVVTLDAVSEPLCHARERELLR